jgi:hypothetical protein
MTRVHSVAEMKPGITLKYKDILSERGDSAEREPKRLNLKNLKQLPVD